METATFMAKGATGDIRVIWRVSADFQRSWWNIAASVAATDKSFGQPLPGILPGRYTTEPFREYIYRDHHNGICGKRLTAILRAIYNQLQRVCELMRKKHQ